MSPFQPFVKIECQVEEIRVQYTTCTRSSTKNINVTITVIIRAILVRQLERMVVKVLAQMVRRDQIILHIISVHRLHPFQATTPVMVDQEVIIRIRKTVCPLNLKVAQVIQVWLHPVQLDRVVYFTPISIFNQFYLTNHRPRQMHYPICTIQTKVS